MKLPLFLGLLLTAVSSLAAPPVNVAGMVFTHNKFERSNIFNGNGSDVLLNADGTYTGLWSSVWNVFDNGRVLSPKTTSFSIPPNGRWSYRVVDDQTAELTIDQEVLSLVFVPNPAQPEQIGGGVSITDSRYNHLFWLRLYNTTPRLKNTSTRSYLAPGRSITLGLVVSRGDRPFLVRVIGPGLRTFGITDALPDPVVNLTATSVISGLYESDQLSASPATLALAEQRVGAFPMPSPRDVGKIFRLIEGVYTFEISAANKTSSGEVLIEIYQLP